MHVCAHFFLRLCYYNRRNPPIHYIVFATPHKKRNTFSKKRSAPPLTVFYFSRKVTLGNTEKVGRKRGIGHEKMKKLRAHGVVYLGLIR